MLTMLVPVNCTSFSIQDITPMTKYLRMDGKNYMALLYLSSTIRRSQKMISLAYRI
jgi:hypothetical protein